MVYFIKQGNYVKIGRARNVKRRIRRLQTASPVKLELIHTKESNSDQRTEKSLHNKFKADRVEGEWFNISKKMKRFLLKQDGNIKKVKKIACIVGKDKYKEDWLVAKNGVEYVERYTPKHKAKYNMSTIHTLNETVNSTS